MDAPTLYIVQFWVAPEAEERLVAWLRDKHLQEVADQPGFLWARMVRLEQTAPDGWRGYTNIYGLTSQAALDAYFKSAARERFAAEAAAFASVLRADRMWGAVALRAPGGAA